MTTLRLYAYRLCEVCTHWLTLVGSHGDHPGHGLF